MNRKWISEHKWFVGATVLVAIIIIPSNLLADLGTDQMQHSSYREFGRLMSALSLLAILSAIVSMLREKKIYRIVSIVYIMILLLAFASWSIGFALNQGN